MRSTVRVERSRHVRGGQAKNWKIIDDSGPKVFRRVYVYSYFGAAVSNAHRVAARLPITTHGLLSVHTEWNRS